MTRGACAVGTRTNMLCGLLARAGAHTAALLELRAVTDVTAREQSKHVTAAA
jgi:hypothetical protein